MTTLAPPPTRTTPTPEAIEPAEPPRGITMKTYRTGAGPLVPVTPAPRRRNVVANLGTGRKLAVLATACLLPSIVLSVVGWGALASIDRNNSAIEHLRQVSGKLYHLDNRNSEIKADGFRAMLDGDRESVISDTTDDVASANEVIGEILSSDMPAGLRSEIEAMLPAAEAFYSFVEDFVRAPQSDTRNEKPIVDANHELDGVLETLRGSVDAQIDTAERDVAADEKRVMVVLVLTVLLGLAVATVLAVWISRMITRPLRRSVLVLEEVAAGDLSARLDVDSRDEVGQMASALNAALENLSAAFGKLGDNAQALASASEELSATSGQMSGSASESASQAGLVSAAAEQVSRNVQTVATGTEEMSASIREIAQNATNAAGVAAQAVGVAQSTNATVAKLGESSTEVGNVIKVINSIAEQTNLLALNATIEAARAGEAGKGFAVVANEVKELAQETSKATEDISRRIEAIQSDTDAAVAAIAEIGEIIGQINDTQTTIASAVEEQTATTNEMSRNVAEAATGSTDIAQNITGVARTANDTQAAAGSTSQASEELARMASEMQVLVGQFRY